MNFQIWFDRMGGLLGVYGPISPVNWGINQIVLSVAVGGLLISLIVAASQNYQLNREIKRRQRLESHLRASEAHYRALLNVLPDLVMRIDRAGTYLEFLASPDFLLVGNDAPASWIGTQIGDNLPPQIANDRLKAIQKALDTQSVQGYEQDFSIVGIMQMEQVRVIPCGADEVLILVQDISDRKRAEIALRDSEERYRAIYNQASVGLANGTADGRFVDVNPRFCEMLGYSREELLAQPIEKIIHPDDRAQTQTITQELFTDKTPYVFHEKRYLRKDGSFFWSNTGMSAVRDIQGNPKHTLAVIRDISDRIQAEEQLKHDAFHDKLTGLPNRSLLMERLELALKRTKRHPETQFAVLFLDVDNFKAVNDSLGHLVGDKLLLAIATQLKLVVRETDLAARLGGDEFIVLLEEISDLSEAVMVAERILEILQSPINITDQQLFPSASIGIVTSKKSQYHRATDLLQDADLAMYWAKRSGRGRYMVFDSNMHLQAVQRLQIENGLRQALENNEFLLYYQQIVNLKSQKIEAFEALLRWQHPDKGILPPEWFVEVAQEIELILPIDNWVLRTACQQLASWQTRFPGRSLGLSVNLLGQRLKEPLLNQLKDILATYDPEPNSFMLEITENMLVPDFETTCSWLNQVKETGVGIVIDEFGTGYSCLQYLHQLPVCALKVDQSFINMTEPRNQVVAESIITLSKSLGLRAIAEGVHNQQQLQWLQTFGCDAVQGEFLAKPMTVEQATELLQQG
ncbi:MAG: putative bifunctional diguanylate cyclase/phosphodiesterase [Leptolyngbyaceae cyanobacterium]